jgi:hypothetical protein
VSTINGNGDKVSSVLEPALAPEGVIKAESAANGTMNSVVPRSSYNEIELHVHYGAAAGGSDLSIYGSHKFVGLYLGTAGSSRVRLNDAQANQWEVLESSNPREVTGLRARLVKGTAGNVFGIVQVTAANKWVAAGWWGADDYMQIGHSLGQITPWSIQAIGRNLASKTFTTAKRIDGNGAAVASAVQRGLRVLADRASSGIYLPTLNADKYRGADILISTPAGVGQTFSTPGNAGVLRGAWGWLPNHNAWNIGDTSSQQWLTGGGGLETMTEMRARWVQNRWMISVLVVSESYYARGVIEMPAGVRAPQLLVQPSGGTSQIEVHAVGIT